MLMEKRSQSTTALRRAAERLPDLAAALVQLKPDVIFAFGGDVVPFAKKATSSIPIVAWMSNDPVESGMVASIGRPGGNVTGVTLVYDELAGKTLAILKEAAPSISRVAVLWNPDHADPEFRQMKRAAVALGVQLQSLEVRRPDDFDGAYKAALAERAEGLIIVSSRLMSRQRQQIVEFAAKNRIIVVGGWGEWTKDGALLTYGPNTTETMQRVAVYVAKILKGAHPSDMPMERPTHFDLVINLKIAKSFGLTLPPTLLGRADQVNSWPDRTTSTRPQVFRHTQHSGFAHCLGAGRRISLKGARGRPIHVARQGHCGRNQCEHEQGTQEQRVVFRHQQTIQRTVEHGQHDGKGRSALDAAQDRVR